MTKLFPLLVEAELKSATDKFGPIFSLHEAYAIILEEVDELWEAIKGKKFTQADVLGELVQVAAMCQRTAMDCLKMLEPPKEGL